MGHSNPEVAVIICNWNKKDYVLKCIASVQQLNYSTFDLYVVDNASSDGSAEAIRKEFPEVTLIQNNTNKGGSGGFNTGIRAALQKECYQYVYLLDNDIILDRDALNHLVGAMQEDKSLGVAGSKIYIMDIPNRLQELGAWIDWGKLHVRPNKKNYDEVVEVVEDIEVDYVPACSLLVRTEAIKKAGVMDEEYFLYWDDIEWQHRIRLAGYKVKAIAASKVWHKMGVANKTSTMTTYYFWRNRLHFFNKYLPLERRCHIEKIIFQDYFQGLFMSILNGNRMTARSMYEGVMDAIKGKRGRASEGQFGPLDISKRSFHHLTEKYDQFAIINNEFTNTVETGIKRRYPELNLEVQCAQAVHEKTALLIPCSHVLDENADIISERENSYWVDQYLNVLPANSANKALKDRYIRKKGSFLNSKVPQYMELLRQQREIGAEANGESKSES